MRIQKTILLILINFLIISCSNYMKIIARYNGGIIYVKDIIKEYKELPENERIKYKTIDDYYRFVRKIAVEKIIYKKASLEGIDKKDDVLKQIKNAEKNIGFDILKKKYVYDKININEIDYKKYNKNYEIYQIVKKIDIYNKDNNEKSKELLKNLSKEIKDIESFKEYAKKYSDDITAEDGGYIGKIRNGIMEDALDKEISGLPVNKLSKIVESSNGYHLFYITKIEEVPVKELLKDKNLYNLIYNEKRNKLEEDWFKSLLNDNSLKIYGNALKTKKMDDEIVIKYKDKNITKKEFFETADAYRQNYFPEPSFDDLLSLAKNLGLNLILENLSSKKSVRKSKEFRNKIQIEKKYIMIEEYIKTHLIPVEITDDMINNFYEKNKKILFSGKTNNGTIFTQQINEVRNFITDRLKSELIQQSRYDLYRKLVKDENLVIDNEKLKLLKSILEK